MSACHFCEGQADEVIVWTLDNGQTQRTPACLLCVEDVLAAVPATGSVIGIGDAE